MTREEQLSFKEDTRKQGLKFKIFGGILTFIGGLAFSIASEYFYKAGAYKMAEMAMDELFKD